MTDTEAHNMTDTQNRTPATTALRMLSNCIAEKEAEAIRLRKVNADLLAALKWAQAAWEAGALKNEDGQTPDFDVVSRAIAKAEAND